jgi:hypothetical protein
MDPFIEAYDKLFAGRRDVYAKGYPDPNKPEKYRYATVREALTPQVLAQHFKGDLCVGVYPLVDNKVSWFAIDFDAPKGLPEGTTLDQMFDITFEAGKAQLVAFEKAGLQVYLERSRSGKGIHVWGFLAEPMLADTVRRALKPLLTDHSIYTSRDRMYPVQPSTSGLDEGLGNLIALPFFGGVRTLGFSSFVDAETRDVIPPRTFIATIQHNHAAVLEKLAARSPTTLSLRRSVGSSADSDTAYRPKSPVSGALKLISAYGCKFMRHAWLNRRTLAEPEWYAAIQQTTCFRNGLEFAQAISRDYPGYREEEVASKFSQAMRKPPVGCQWIKDNYPELACENCELRAPYYMADRSLLNLASAVETKMERMEDVAEDLDRIRKLDSGELSSGLPTGISTLDRYIRLRNSEMIVVGAMQSLGKTALMVDLAVRLSRNGIPVFVFSPETGRTSLRTRMLSRAAEVDNLALRGERLSGPMTADEWQRVTKAAEELEELPLYLDYGATTADDVLRQIEDTLLIHSIPLDSPYVVFFDYLQFGAKQEGDDSEYDRLSRLSSEFKYVAKCLDRPVIVFSQLRRENEGDDEPEINWYKGTGRIESDMDVGIIITGARVSGEIAPRRITIVKQREGQANIGIDLLFNQMCFKFDTVASSVDPKPLLGNDDLGEFGEAV